MIRFGLCCIFRDQPIKFRTTTATAMLRLPKRGRLARLAELPFTTREDLQRSYPYDMFAMPLRDIVRIHSASGTTGAPIVAGYTRNDLRNWTECTARLLAAAGVIQGMKCSAYPACAPG